MSQSIFPGRKKIFGVGFPRLFRFVLEKWKKKSQRVFRGRRRFYNGFFEIQNERARALSRTGGGGANYQSSGVPVTVDVVQFFLCPRGGGGVAGTTEF